MGFLQLPRIHKRVDLPRLPARLFPERTSFPIGKDVSRIAFSKRLRVKRAVSERRPVVVGKRRPDGVLSEKARLFEPGADSRRVPVERP